MSITVLEGFETGLKPPSIGQTVSGYTIETTTPRSGAYYARVAATAAGVAGSVSTLSWFCAGVNPGVAAGATVGGTRLGCAIRVANLSGFGVSPKWPLFSLKDTPGNQPWARVHLTSTGSLEVGFGVGAAVTEGVTGIAATTAPGVIVANTWHYVEMWWYPRDSGGRFQVFVDNVSVIDYTGDTDAGNSFDKAGVTVHVHGGATNAASTVDVDDIYAVDPNDSINNVGRLGPINIEMLKPTGDSAIQFSRNGGPNNHSRLDERPVSASDYVQSSVIGQRDVYDMGDRVLTGDVVAVAPVTVAHNPDVGLASLRLLVKSAAAENLSAASALSQSDGGHQRSIVERDPNTAAVWTTAGVNAALAGFEVA